MTSSCPWHTNSTAVNRRPVPDRDLLLAMKAQANSFVLGTRKSNLALIQTGHVADDLRLLHNGPSSPPAQIDSRMDLDVDVNSNPDSDADSDSENNVIARKQNQTQPPTPEYTFSIESMTTVGDRNQTTPLHLLSPYSSSQPAKSLWTDELEAKLINGHFDMLIHSLKDVPTVLKDGCEIGCMVKRHDPRDALVIKEGLPYRSLEELPDGSVVGTGSVRRVAQLKRAFPNLVFEDMRGNLNTRFSKLDNPSSPFSALILAMSGLSRLGMAHRVVSALSAPTLMHAVGQGALAVEIRSDDNRTRNCLRGLGHWPTEWTCGAERGCLRVLEGGCSVPVGVESEIVELEESDLEKIDAEVEDPFKDEIEEPLKQDSPMLHFSGLVDVRPDTRPSTPTFSKHSLPPLRRRYAKLRLHACVTATDGSKHVLYEPKPVIVRSYRQAEKFGEECARKLRAMGASEVLDEINKVRKEKEQADLQRAIERSKALVEEQEKMGKVQGGEAEVVA
ncbi:porphobilinogen deaminase [Kwoniella dejecticola CBS 10117]|uniref:hydroxymethylbilane synthase n=1 Tax=Kwoniella dejecticola CBS 10117 TaxID=1296121 RepID=A0A1A6AH45_9TREE|nr:porphobilinogen deaminase [Kwoniella dejecticola CBS 10117]OBR89405.1 porphobilinogen deaminase [Kwoniella dejecticola CBS 10117]